MQVTGLVVAERPRFVFVARRLDPGRLYELIVQARLGTLGLEKKQVQIGRRVLCHSLCGDIGGCVGDLRLGALCCFIG